MTMPTWLEALQDVVCKSCINEVKGRMSGFSCRWAEPEQNHWGVWYLQIAPSVIEISGGKEDGATVFDFIDVDLATLPRLLDEVESFEYDPDYGEAPHLTLVEKKGDHKVVVEIYFEPFEGDDPDTVFDANVGTWREKREGEE